MAGKASGGCGESHYVTGKVAALRGKKLRFVNRSFATFPKVSVITNNSHIYKQMTTDTGYRSSSIIDSPAYSYSTNFIHSAMMMFDSQESPLTKQSTEILRTDTAHEIGIALTQIFIDFGSREQLRMLTVIGMAKVDTEEFFDRWHITKGTVALFYIGHFFGSKVMALAMLQEMHTLGIELSMADRGVHIDHVSQLHTEKATAPRGVGK